MSNIERKAKITKLIGLARHYVATHGDSISKDRRPALQKLQHAADALEEIGSSIEAPMGDPVAAEKGRSIFQKQLAIEKEKPMPAPAFTKSDVDAEVGRRAANHSTLKSLQQRRHHANPAIAARAEASYSKVADQLRDQAAASIMHRKGLYGAAFLASPTSPTRADDVQKADAVAGFESHVSYIKAANPKLSHQDAMAKARRDLPDEFERYQSA